MESPASLSRSPQAARRAAALAAVNPVLQPLQLLRQPIPEEKQRLMRERWAALDPRWRTAGQGFGRQATGCGATIGIHPACDFACTGCYLGADANQAQPIGLDEALRQLERLRAWLGPKGNTQITDGEVTLRPIGELLAILRYARQIGLIPMVMSHGDSFRRRPGLLERLMVEGGLTELSIHVDSTQRGRLGFKDARDENALEPLRDEYATLVRTARRITGLALRAAMTLTITADNLAEVPGVVEWALRNRDAFGMLSFQPIAAVGRTKSGLPGVSVSELWNRIEIALTPYGFTRRGPGVLSFGHPACTRFEPLVVFERRGDRPRVVPIVREHSDDDVELLREFFDRGFGGINFRDDSALERLSRAAGVFLIDPRWLTGPVRRWVASRLAECGTSWSRLVWAILRKKVRIDTFSVVSHHFMSTPELETPIGQERLSACLFRVPIGDELVSMCRVNASRLRESFYAGKLNEFSGGGAVPDNRIAESGRTASP